MKRASIIVLWFMLVSAGVGAEELIMQVKFTNPSEIEPKQETSRYYLPPELKLDDIIDTGGLDLTYDETRSLYYVHKDVVLEPQETRAFRVTVNNVWMIDSRDIQFLKNQVNERVEALREHEHYEEARLLGEQLLKELDQINLTQVSAGDADIAKKIEIFRVNRDRMRNIRHTVLLMKDFTDFVAEEVEAKKLPKTMSMIIKVSNPSEAVEKTTLIKKYLAEGLGAQHIRDAQDFEVHFDPERRLYYVTREVTLKPGEARQYVLTFDDRWVIRDQKLGDFVDEAGGIAVELESTEFAERAAFLMSEINKNIDTIRNLQAQNVSIRDKIAFFQDNIKRVGVIEQNILELKRMLEIIRERERQKRLEEILRRVFKEAAWKIIYGTIFLLGLISLMTYLLWWGQAKKRQSETYEDIE